jgi:hypothetical protein
VGQFESDIDSSRNAGEDAEGTWFSTSEALEATKQMAPVYRGHLSIEVRLSGGGFRLQRPMSGRVFDDNLLALVIAVMPRMQEPAMKAAVVSDYDLPHADPMARLHVVADVRL